MSAGFERPPSSTLFAATEIGPLPTTLPAPAPPPAASLISTITSLDFPGVYGIVEEGEVRRITVGGNPK